MSHSMAYNNSMYNAHSAHNAPHQSYCAPSTTVSMPDFNWMGYKNPDLDESWTPGPPPTTPPDFQEPEEDRAEIAAARKEAT
jgi:hypothetical protein